jgi:hypothetical protein
MYSVRGPDGKLYGPVPIDVLRQWVREGRILPTTMVIEQDSGFEVMANTIPGLFSPGPADWSQPPSPYPRSQNSYQPAAGYAAPLTQQDLNTGWTYFGIGTFGCVCCTILALIFYPMAIMNANKVLAAGDQRGQTLKILSIIFLILAIVALIFSIAFNLIPFMSAF